MIVAINCCLEPEAMACLFLPDFIATHLFHLYCSVIVCKKPSYDIYILVFLIFGTFPQIHITLRVSSMKGCVDWNIPLNKLDQICFKGQGVYSGTFPMRVYQFRDCTALCADRLFFLVNRTETIA